MVRSCFVPRYGSEAPKVDEFYGQRDVMRMPEPEEFRQLRQRRATPLAPKFGPFDSKFGPQGF